MRQKLKFNIGTKYGRVTIIKELPQGKYNERIVLCKCDCGHESPQRLKSILLGIMPRFCVCLVKKTKAQSDHEYWFRKKSKRAAITIGDLPNEEWKNVVGYEGVYLVSNMGRVKGVNRVNKKEA